MLCFRSLQVQIGKWFVGTLGITNHAHSQVSDPGCALPLILLCQGLERCTQPFVRGHWLDHTNTIMPAEIMYDTTQKVNNMWRQSPLTIFGPSQGSCHWRGCGHFRCSSWPPHWKPFWSPASLFQGFCTTSWLGLHLLKHTLFQGRMGNPFSRPSLWGHGWGGIRFARLQSSMISTPT